MLFRQNAFAAKQRGRLLFRLNADKDNVSAGKGIWFRDLFSYRVMIAGGRFSLLKKAAQRELSNSGMRRFLCAALLLIAPL